MTTVYLIPSPLSDSAEHTIPAYVLKAIRECKVIFAENERTTRRMFKAMDRSIIIDDFEWHEIHKSEPEQVQLFLKAISEKKTIGITSEAGCPGVADPGQKLIAVAQEKGCTIRPLAGPSSIILALMGSGMNGQQFSFHGYLPIEPQNRKREIEHLESLSAKHGSTHIFIETPYRNNQLLETVLNTCKNSTRLCIAWDLSGKNEHVITRTISDWKKDKPDIHKIPAIFLLQA